VAHPVFVAVYWTTTDRKEIEGKVDKNALFGEIIRGAGLNPA
jgi:hypothetical protein